MLGEGDQEPESSSLHPQLWHSREWVTWPAFVVQCEGRSRAPGFDGTACWLFRQVMIEAAVRLGLISEIIVTKRSRFGLNVWFPLCRAVEMLLHFHFLILLILTLWTCYCAVFGGMERTTDLQSSKWKTVGKDVKSTDRVWGICAGNLQHMCWSKVSVRRATSRGVSAVRMRSH